MQSSGIPHGELRVQPSRARKSVHTYNLKVLSGSVARTRTRKPYCKTSISNTHDASARTVETEPQGIPGAAYQGGLEQDGSSQSSGLTSPMMSPKLRALETSLGSEEATTGEESHSADSRKSMSFYDCFNSQTNPRGHLYSANRLFTRGIWIGYLAPDRQGESFRGLPSFQELKFNCAKFSPPHPPVIQGSAGQTRQAVCRGCAASNSAVIPLGEIQFYRKSVSHTQDSTNISEDAS